MGEGYHTVTTGDLGKASASDARSFRVVICDRKLDRSCCDCFFLDVKGKSKPYLWLFVQRREENVQEQAAGNSARAGLSSTPGSFLPDFLDDRRCVPVCEGGVEGHKEGKSERRDERKRNQR